MLKTSVVGGDDSAQPPSGRTSPLVEVLPTDAGLIRDTARKLCAQAGHLQYLGPMTREAEPDWAVDFLTRAGFRGGVKVSIVTATPVPPDEALPLLRNQVDIRLSETDHPWFLIVDQRSALSSIGGFGQQQALLLHGTQIAGVIEETFFRYWESAVPWAALMERPTDVETAILESLAEGMTDGSISRRIDLSTRTIRRHVTSMMERVGARSASNSG